MQTIVELPEFLRKSEKLLTASQRIDIINYLAAHPAAGDIIQELAESVSCDGLLMEGVKVAAFVSYITITMNQYLCSY